MFWLACLFPVEEHENIWCIHLQCTGREVRCIRMYFCGIFVYRVSLLNLWSFELFWQRNISLFSALCYVMLAEELFRYWLHSSLRPDVCFCSLHVYVKYWRSFPSWCDSSTTCIWILAYLLYYVLFRSVIVLFRTQRVNKYIINDDIHSHGGVGDNLIPCWFCALYVWLTDKEMISL